MSRIGLIRVLSTDDDELLNSHGKLLEAFIADPGLRVVSRCIQGHPKGLWNSEEEQKALPKIVHLGREMVHEDRVAALLVSCVADPGVPELREALQVPVIGAGSASAAVALALGRRVGALSIVPGVLAPIANVLGHHLVGWEVPEGVTTTVDLMSGEGRGRFVRASERLKGQGAEVILLACTGFSTIRIAPFLEERVGLPVLDPVIAAGLAAYYAAVGNRRAS
ncbi:MAG: aspartate/glutamate racemase family protein [Anaerolineae bacterium]